MVPPSTPTRVASMPSLESISIETNRFDVCQRFKKKQDLTVVKTWFSASGLFSASVLGFRDLEFLPFNSKLFFDNLLPNLKWANVAKVWLKPESFYDNFHSENKVLQVFVGKIIPLKKNE